MVNHLKRIVFSLVGACLGAAAGGLLTYLIILFLIPERQDQAFIFIVVFALITSQLGMLLGQYFTIRHLEKRDKAQQVSER